VLLLLLWLLSPAPSGNPALPPPGKGEKILPEGNPDTGAVPSPQKEVIAPVTAALENSSLRNTDVDRPTRKGGLLFYFDYFRNLRGEKSPVQIRELLRADLFAHYPQAEAERLLDLFDRYLSSREAIEKRAEGMSVETLESEGLTVTQWEDSIRSEFFTSQEMQELFGDYRQMLGQPSKAQERRQRYEEYRSALAASPQQGNATAQALFGPEAAIRLGKLEQQRHEWKGRIAEYEQQKAVILASSGLDSGSSERSVRELRERLFDENERKRVEAIERIRSERGEVRR
jgi:lipase chaperone LimK